MRAAGAASPPFFALFGAGVLSIKDWGGGNGHAPDIWPYQSTVHVKDTERSLMAATNINRVVMTGNLTSDPELRTLPSGTAVCDMRIACNTPPQRSGLRGLGG